MQTQINIPIYRAKKINDDEWVEGYYIPFNPDSYECILSIDPISTMEDWNRSGLIEYGEVRHKIDANTLTISFDNGETFDDINECKKAIDYVKGLAEIWKD